MEKTRKTVMDRFMPKPKKTPVDTKKPFSAGERIKQIKNVRKERENIMKELDN